MIRSKSFGSRLFDYANIAIMLLARAGDVLSLLARDHGIL